EDDAVPEVKRPSDLSALVGLTSREFVALEFGFDPPVLGASVPSLHSLIPLRRFRSSGQRRHHHMAVPWTRAQRCPRRKQMIRLTRLPTRQRSHAPCHCCRGGGA